MKVKNEQIATCIKERGNWSKLEKAHRFDNKDFDKAVVKADLPYASPKLYALLENIRSLDARDMKEHGHCFKHFIYSDIKSAFGAKLIASILASDGYEHAYRLEKTSRGMSFAFDNALIARKTSNVFATLTSVSFFEKPIGVNFRKDILRTFNARPENIHGEGIRIIVLDSGFREGIDLFDVKYVHLVEPIATKADEKQAIGRGTRYCGQKGLVFDTKAGWPLHVYRYETVLSAEYQAYMLSENPAFAPADTFFNLFLKYSNIDPKKLAFSNELEHVVIGSAVDKELTRNVHDFNIPTHSQSGGSVYTALAQKIARKYGHLAWPPITVENGCVPKGGTASIVEFTPTQDFVRAYFTPKYSKPGMLLYHSVGTGKTCTAIATASTTFEKAGYTIIYVTRHTLKADVWKNMFEQVCSVVVQEQINKGATVPDAQAKKLAMISKKWFEPMSYRQFSNMLAGKNQLANVLFANNGATDPLYKTLIIVDEAHKLFAADVEGQEKADIGVIKDAFLNSNKVSGRDGAKVLLMTATPYTSDAMDMIRLFNLCRPHDDQLPEDFETFSELYLDENGLFTSKTRDKFYNQIAGYTSYLNRAKDIRSFAYPVINTIEVPMSEYNFDDTLVDTVEEMHWLKKKTEVMAVQVSRGTLIIKPDLKKLEKQLLKHDKDTLGPSYEMHAKCVSESKAAGTTAKIKKEYTANLAKCKANLKTQIAQIKAGYAHIIKALKDDAKVAIKAKKEAKAQITDKLTTQIKKYKDDEAADIDSLNRTTTFASCTASAEAAYGKALAEVMQKPSKEKCKEIMDRIKATLKTMKVSIREKLAYKKATLLGMIKIDKTLQKEDTKRLKEVTKFINTTVEKDKSQQMALEKCLTGQLAPRHSRLQQSQPHEGFDIDEIVEEGPTKKNIYAIAGHGGETAIDFKSRNKVPDDRVIVVFPVCARPNYMDIGCKVLAMFNDPKYTKFLANPVKYQAKIENHLKHPIRIYLPDEYFPQLRTNLFLDFEKDDHTVLVKSGVYRVNRIPEVDRSILSAPTTTVQSLGTPVCNSFVGVLSDDGYTEESHRELFKGNLYAPASEDRNDGKLCFRKFNIQDIIDTVGKGIYYYIGCRSSQERVADEHYKEVFARSDSQQRKKRRSHQFSNVVNDVSTDTKPLTPSTKSLTKPSTKSLTKPPPSTKPPSPSLTNTRGEVKRMTVLKKLIKTSKDDVDIGEWRRELRSFAQTAKTIALFDALKLLEFTRENADAAIVKIGLKTKGDIITINRTKVLVYNKKNVIVDNEVIGMISKHMTDSSLKCDGSTLAKEVVKLLKNSKSAILLPKTVTDAADPVVFNRLCTDVFARTARR